MDGEEPATTKWRSNSGNPVIITLACIHSANHSGSFLPAKVPARRRGGWPECRSLVVMKHQPSIAGVCETDSSTYGRGPRPFHSASQAVPDLVPVSRYQSPSLSSSKLQRRLLASDLTCRSGDSPRNQTHNRSPARATTVMGTTTWVTGGQVKSGPSPSSMKALQHFSHTSRQCSLRRLP